MFAIILAIALMGQLSNMEEASPLKCFDLDENQKVCIEEEDNKGATSALPTEEFPTIINEVEKVSVYDI